MKVTIIGPNLRKQEKGDFHVHHKNCVDIHRDPQGYGYNSCEPHLTIEAGNREEVAEVVFSDIIDENPDTTAADYIGEFHFAPCVTLL